MNHATVTLVGIGADGWDGLAGAGRDALAAAKTILGGERHLAMLPADVTAERVPWPSPLLPALPGLLAAHADRGLCVLASGDPMWHGIGARLAELLTPDRLVVLPHPSAVSLACARMGWAVESVAVVRTVGSRSVHRLRLALANGRRVVVLSQDAGTPAAVAALLASAGFGPSRLTVLGSLGGPAESRVEGTAAGWSEPLGDPLNVVAIHAEAEHDGAVLSTAPGRRDGAFVHDGALTKREHRALAISRLAPRWGELLWDVGAGAGSVAVEWMRAAPAACAIAVEARGDRAARIVTNATRLGVPDLRVVEGTAPAALAGLPTPDAVFIGGGLTVDGVFDACWTALRPAGRLVVHAVTLEAEQLLVGLARRHGGDLTRIGIDRAEPLGGFTAWQPARRIVQWAVEKP